MNSSECRYYITQILVVEFGCTLMRQQTPNNAGKEFPIAFFSKRLAPTQMDWSTIEREAFCVLEALNKFDTWVFGGKICVFSNRNPLTSSAPHGAKLSRWVLALQRYNLTISYRKGIQHGNADALSRLAIDSVK
ncbi:hypothetical protein AVEN_263720-1 [Araneus ventricosus]|uniref:Reverse transcriptase RNase H-like domain-containing protein n=1 Tax=Araneus ventricosus TaxID=182803 RepID=A0A4Y2AU46_ARAVE|nr:hypothetical protein AVEN_263720-1 [Araneus ventricosus]